MKRGYVRAVLSFAVGLVSLVAVLWAVGKAQSGRPSSATGDALASVFNAVLPVLPALVFVFGGLIAVAVTYYMISMIRGQTQTDFTTRRL